MPCAVDVDQLWQYNVGYSRVSQPEFSTGSAERHEIFPREAVSTKKRIVTIKMSLRKTAPMVRQSVMTQMVYGFVWPLSPLCTPVNQTATNQNMLSEQHLALAYAKRATGGFIYQENMRSSTPPSNFKCI